MKRLFLVMAVCACVAGASVVYVYAQQRTRIKASNNYIVRDIPNFGRFDAIRSEGSVDIEFAQTTDGTTNVKVYGSDNVVDNLEVTNDAGTLVARYRNSVSIEGNSRLKVVASGPALKKISSRGSGDIRLMGNINTGDIAIETSGSGDIQFNTMSCGNFKVEKSGSGDMEGRSLICKTIDISNAGSGDAEIDHVDAASVKISVAGSSDIKIAGKATDVVITVRGSGDVDASDLRAEMVKASASGSGDISCYATKRLDASSSGSASIIYGGNPATVNIPQKQRGIRPR